MPYLIGITYKLTQSQKIISMNKSDLDNSKV